MLLVMTHFAKIMLSKILYEFFCYRVANANVAVSNASPCPWKKHARLIAPSRSSSNKQKRSNRESVALSRPSLEQPTDLFGIYCNPL